MIDSVVLLMTFSILYLFIIEIFTMLFRFTGLTEEKSRFQVISLLTACGFTTSQSELITSSERRKKLAFITMMFGYVFTVIIVSVVANMFVQMNDSQFNTFVGVGIALFCVFLVLFILIKSKVARLFLDNFVNGIYHKFVVKNSNNAVILDMIDEKIIASIHLTHLPLSLRETALKYSGIMRKYGIQLLVVTRGGKTLELIDGHTILEPNDFIVVFGKEEQINAFFESPDSL